MAAELGWVGLGVSPDFTGFKGTAERETSKALAAAGTTSGKRFGGAFKTAAKASLVGVAALTAGALKFAGDSVVEAREAAKVGKQTEAVIRSTGKAANVTERGVGKLAGRLSDMAGIDDEVIQSGANVLLTFTKIRNETGEGNKVFDQATKATLNMSVALKQDLGSAAIQVGKALNDPVKGVTALGRAGVQFTEDQKATIKALVEQGDTLGAQKIILKELDKQFAGSAKAQADEADKLTVAWGNFKEEVGTELLPVMDDLAVFLRKKGIPAAKDFFQWVRDEGIPMAKDFAGFAKDAAGEVKDLIGFLDDLPKPAKIAGLVALVGGIGAAKLRGGGGGALGTVGKVVGIAKPVPVFVTNQGFGGGAGGGVAPTSTTKKVLGGVAKYGGPAAVLGGAALGLKELYDFNRGGDSGLAFLGGGRINDMIGETRKGIQGIKTDVDRLDTTAKRMGPYKVGIESNVQTVLNFARQYEGVLEGIPREVRTTFIQSVVRNNTVEDVGGRGGKTPETAPSGVQISIGSVAPQNYNDFMQEMQRRTRAGSLDGRRP